MKDYATFGFELKHKIRLVKDKNLKYVFKDEETAKKIFIQIIEMIKDNYNEIDYINDYNDKLLTWANTT